MSSDPRPSAATLGTAPGLVPNTTPHSTVASPPVTSGQVGRGIFWRSRRLVAVGLLAVLGAAGFVYWSQRRGLESTDDAALDGDVVALSSRTAGTVTAVHFADNQRVEEGAVLIELDPAPARARLLQAQAEVTAAEAQVAAARASVELTEKTAVAGQDIARASLTGASVAVAATTDQIAEAQASLASAKTLHSKAQLDRDRAQRLFDTKAVSSADLEAAQADFERTQAMVLEAAARVATLQRSTSQARARVSEASARLGQAQETTNPQVAQARAQADALAARVTTAKALRDLAELDLSYTRILAPHAGVVSRRSVTPGQVVAVGQGLVMLTPDAGREGDVWVTGNFKETQLEHMKVGQPATLFVDAYGRELHGHVQSFSGATGSRFALLPPDNASGNFTKVVQRVPVRVSLDEVPTDLLLIPGLSVELVIDTRL